MAYVTDEDAESVVLSKGDIVIRIEVGVPLHDMEETLLADDRIREIIAVG